MTAAKGAQFKTGKLIQNRNDAHKRGRRLVAFFVVICVVSVLVLTVCLVRWASPTAAQTPAAESTIVPQSASESDLAARVDELSKSQDRLVTAVIGAVGAVGTVLLVVVGLSTFQANRNAERETELIRGIALNHIAEAVTTATTQIDGIVNVAKSELATQNADSLEKSEAAIAEKLQDASDKMKSISDAEVRRLRQTVNFIRKDSKAFGEAAATYFQWLLGNKAESELTFATDDEYRRYGIALLNLADMGVELFPLLEPADRSGLGRASLAALERGLSLFNKGFTIPEQNELWYVDRNKNQVAVERIIRNLSLGFAALPADSSAFQRRLDRLRKYLPAKSEPLGSEELQRLVDRELARQQEVPTES